MYAGLLYTAAICPVCCVTLHPKGGKLLAGDHHSHTKWTFGSSVLPSEGAAGWMRSQTLAQVLDWMLPLLLALLPFELRVGLDFGVLTITNVELILAATIGLWLVLLLVERRAPLVPRRFWLPVLVVLGAFCLSAMLAPQFRGAALKFATRQVQGGLLALCVVERVTLGGWPLARRLLRALLVGGILSALLGLAELSEWPFVLAALSIFKVQPTLMGGLLRLSGTFEYANIAAMYYEAVLPLALVWAMQSVGSEDKRQKVKDKNSRAKNEGRASRIPHLASRIPLWLLKIQSKLKTFDILLLLTPLLFYTATLFTYSRASFVTAIAIVVLTSVAILLLQSHTQSLLANCIRVLPTVGLLLATAALLAFSPTMRLRLAGPDITSWYDAAYSAQPLPQLVTNGLYRSEVTVTNNGRLLWRATGLRPFSLSYHWLDAQTRAVVRFNGLRTPLPGAVEVGSSVTLSPLVQAPEQPGRYLLAWDMVQESASWLSEDGTPVAEVPVEVTKSNQQSAIAPVKTAPPPPAEPSGTPQILQVVPPPPDRGPLWHAALTLWREHPLLGIGPDVFRHVYGPLLGLQVFDDRIHTNNLYLELLVGTGLVGTLACAALLGCVGLPAILMLWWARRDNLRSTQPQSIALLACLAGLAAFLIHGTLDMFLEYTATYLLLWLLLGLTSILTDEVKGSA